jgi:YggT family protein
VFVISEFLASLAVLINMLFNIIYILLVIRIILSWFQVSPYNELVQILFKITEPILAPFRRLPLQIGAIDFSPVIAFIILRFINIFLVGVLRNLAIRLA